MAGDKVPHHQRLATIFLYSGQTAAFNNYLNFRCYDIDLRRVPWRKVATDTFKRFEFKPIYFYDLVDWSKADPPNTDGYGKLNDKD